MRTALRCSFIEGGNLTVTTSLLYDTEATPVSAPLHTLGHPHTDALLGAHSADEYASLMHSVVDSLGERFRTTERAASAKDRTGLQAAVDAVDLDAAGVGNAEALREVDALYADNAVWFHPPATSPTSTAPSPCPPSPPKQCSRPSTPRSTPTTSPRSPPSWNAASSTGPADTSASPRATGSSPPAAPSRISRRCSSPAKTSSPDCPIMPTSATVAIPMMPNLAEVAPPTGQPAVTGCPDCASSPPTRPTSPCPGPRSSSVSMPRRS